MHFSLQRGLMNKAELIDIIAAAADLSKTQATQVLTAITDGITAALAKGDMVALAGFGTFVVRERAARNGRNPKTGETMQIKASKAPAFKASKALKDAVQK
jgi:DNA-binding protein HU-beta